MDRSNLTKLLLNILYELTTPNQAQRLDTPSLVSILSLVNLLGIINYISEQSDLTIPAMVENSASETRDLFGSLLGTLNSLKGGGNETTQSLNPQTLLMMFNLLSNLNKKKNDDNLDTAATTNE